MGYGKLSCQAPAKQYDCAAQGDHPEYSWSPEHTRWCCYKYKMAGKGDERRLSLQQEATGELVVSHSTCPVVPLHARFLSFAPCALCSTALTAWSTSRSTTRSPRSSILPAHIGQMRCDAMCACVFVFVFLPFSCLYEANCKGMKGASRQRLDACMAVQTVKPDLVPGM